MTRKQPSNGRGRRSRTVSISLGDRGQTTQDFAVGIGVFILAVAFVFSFMPSILTPFDSTISGGQTAQADRIADQIVDNLSSDVDSNSPNEIRRDDFADYNDSDENLASEFGLRTSNEGHLIDHVNVTIQPLNETTVIEGLGTNYDDQSAASSARIVTFDENYLNECDPACRLVVRVW